MRTRRLPTGKISDALNHRDFGRLAREALMRMAAGPDGAVWRSRSIHPRMRFPGRRIANEAMAQMLAGAERLSPLRPHTEYVWANSSAGGRERGRSRVFGPDLGTPEAASVPAVPADDRPPLATVELGATGMQITRIGLGAWAMGGDWHYGWGDQDDGESVATIEHALELGINWIDTAAVYGYGHSEEVIGKVLEGVSRRPLLFSKASLVEGPDGKPIPCLERDSIRREIEGTLSRLGVDSLDLYQVHTPEDESKLEEGWTTFRELQEEGLVRHIGVSNFDVSQMRRVRSIAPVETLQPPYSLVDRQVEDEILPFCEREGIGVIAYSPMGSGLLTGRMSRERIDSLPETDWRRGEPMFREPALRANLAQAGRVVEVAAELGLSPGVVAIGWVLRNPAVDGAIVGLRNPSQVDDLIAAAEFELDDAAAARLD